LKIRKRLNWTPSSRKAVPVEDTCGITKKAERKIKVGKEELIEKGMTSLLK
jgi:hypothetical protein